MVEQAAEAVISHICIASEDVGYRGLDQENYRWFVSTHAL